MNCKNKLSRVLVTGASGFIGQHLVNRLLRDKLYIRVLIRASSTKHNWNDNVDIVKGDICDIKSIRRSTSGVDTVFHLAGKVHDLDGLIGRDEHDEVTLKGTQNLIAASRESDVKRVVFLSTLSIYGTSSQVIQDETASSDAVSPYGRAKFQAEQCVLEQGAKFDIHVCCLRPAMVYGPGCKGNLPRMIKMIDRGLFPPLPGLGNRRSMVHVANLVEAAILAATHPTANGQCYIVTDEKAYSTRELYEMICQGLGKRVPMWHVPLGMLKMLGYVGDLVGRVRGKRFLFDSNALEKLIGSAWYNSEKISQELGYLPTITFEKALPELIEWYRGETVKCG